MNNQLTVVIPCKNEGSNVVKTIKLLLKQDISLKIIVADSSDDTITNILLKNYHKLHSSNLGIITGGLPAVARNKGAMLTTTPYILFLDADIYIEDTNLLQKCLTVMQSGDYDLLTCKLRTTDKKYNWVYKCFDVVQWISSKTKPFAVGGFMLFKTRTFRALNGFNEEDKIAEDYHLSSKISPKKFKILNLFVYTPSRRFEKKGVWYMIKLAFASWWNRNNDEFFKQDYNYWK